MTKGQRTSEPLRPLLYRDFTTASSTRCNLLRAALAFWQPSLTCSLDNALEFLAEGWIVGSSCSFLHQCLHREPWPQLQELRNRGRRLCILPPPGVRRGEIDVGEVERLTGRKRREAPFEGLSVARQVLVHVAEDEI